MQYPVIIWKGTHLDIVTYNNERIILQTSLEDAKIRLNLCDMFLLQKFVLFKEDY